MDLFEVLLGGGQKKRQEYEDFTHRYDQGPPSEGYSDQEVLERYGEVAHKLPAQDYEAAVRDAMSRLSPEEQAELLRSIQERTRGRDAAPEPRAGAGGGGLDDLARSVRELHEQPGRLREVLASPSQQVPAGNQPPRGPGGAGAGPAGLPTGLENIFASPVAKAAIAGITAMLVRRMLMPR